MLMRPAALAITAALLLAGIAGQNALLRSTEATSSSPAISCADQGAAVQGACSPVSLDSPPGAILSYHVFAGEGSKQDPMSLAQAIHLEGLRDGIDEPEMVDFLPGVDP